MRLIDAEVLASDLMERWNTADEQAEKEIVAVLANVVTPILVGQPTVDAVEVVRCKDCVHCADDYVDTGFGAMPAFTCDIFEGYGVGIKPDHYCSYGERGETDG